jgi:hypothetical protein
MEMSKEGKGDDATPWTMSVEDAGKKYYGVSRAKAYAMARSGLMPVISLGRNKRALPRAIEDQLSNKTERPA